MRTDHVAVLLESLDKTERSCMANPSSLQFRITYYILKSYFLNFLSSEIVQRFFPFISLTSLKNMGYVLLAVVLHKRRFVSPGASPSERDKMMSICPIIGDNFSHLVKIIFARFLHCKLSIFLCN